MKKAISICIFLISISFLACDIPTTGYVDGIMEDTSEELKTEMTDIMDDAVDQVTALLLSGLLGGGDDEPEPEPEPEPEEEPIYVELANLPGSVVSDMIIYNPQRDKAQLLIPISNARRPSGMQGGVISLDMASGEVNWEYQSVNSVNDKIVIYYNKVLEHYSVLIADYKKLHSVNVLTGELDWWMELPDSIIGISATKTNIWTEETIVVSAGNTVYMLNSDAMINWQHDFDDTPTAPILNPYNESFVYASVGNCVYHFGAQGIFSEYCADGDLSRVMYNKASGYMYVKIDNQEIVYIDREDEDLKHFSSDYEIVGDMTFSTEGYMTYATLSTKSDGSIDYVVISDQYFDNNYYDHAHVNGNSINIDQWVNPPILDNNNMAYMAGDYNFVYMYNMSKADTCGGFCFKTLPFIGKSFRVSPVLDKLGFLFVATTDGTIYRIDTNRWE